jgi:hypothetical protein
MSLGILLRGTAPKSGLLGSRNERRWLQAVLAQLVKRCDQVVSARIVDSTIELLAHPAGQPLTLTREGRAVQLEAMTSSVGPGYHVFVCELADHSAAALGAEWLPEDLEAGGGYGDETGYWRSRDLEALRAEMCAWVSALATRVLELLDDWGSPVALAMPLDGPRWQLEADVLTPLGPRSKEWLRHVAEKSANGRDFFAWWEPGYGPDYHHRRALVELWCSVPWRAPLDADEARLMTGVLQRLAAHGPVETFELPARELLEIFDLVDASVPADSPLRAVAAAATGSLIGYRRHDAVHTANGWLVTVPGALAVDPSSASEWIASDADRSVHVTSYSAEARVSRRDLEATLGASDHREDDDEVRRTAKAIYVDAVEDRRQAKILQGFAVAGHRFAIVTVVAPLEADDAWLLGVWRSLRPVG